MQVVLFEDKESKIFYLLLSSPKWLQQPVPGSPRWADTDVTRKPDGQGSSQGWNQLSSAGCWHHHGGWLEQLCHNASPVLYREFYSKPCLSYTLQRYIQKCASPLPSSPPSGQNLTLEAPVLSATKA